MQGIALNFNLTPVFDVPSFNTIISSVKTSMGKLGEDIKPIDEAKLKSALDSTRAAFAQTTAQASKFTEETKKGETQIDKLGKSAKVFKEGFNFSGAAFGFNQILQATQTISNGLLGIMNVGINFDKQLAAVGAFTGTTGKDLDVLGDKARKLGIEFASVGDAKAQLEIFSAVLSKMGPSYAQNADAMGKFATNVNVLAKAGGIDVPTAVNVMTNSMLQFGLRTGDAAKDADTSKRIIDGLAASARVGAAQIPQVGEAILQVGVMAKSSKMSFEDTAAAIQVMAVGGKTGAEAGVALRNVLGLIQRPSAEASASLRRMGTNSMELSNLLTEKGLGAAMEKLKGGMKNFSTDAERNNALMKLFGMENATAAGILMDNLDRYKEFQQGIKDGQMGIGTAMEMFTQKSGSATGIVAEMKARIEDLGISISHAMGTTAQAVLLGSTQVAPMVTSLVGIKTVIPSLSEAKSMVTGIGSGFAKLGGMAGGALKSLGTGIIGLIPTFGATGAAGVTAGAAVQSAWLPITIAIAAIAAAGVGLYALFGGFKESAQDQLKGVEALQEANNKMIDENKSAQTEEKKRISLIAEYEKAIKDYNSVLTQSGATTEEIEQKEQRLFDIRDALNVQYPMSLDLSAKDEENLQRLKETTGLLGTDTSKFTDENKKLVKEYIELTGKIDKLTGKENLSAQQKQRLATVTSELKVIYPGVIEKTSSLSEACQELARASGESSTELGKLQNELIGLEETAAQLQSQNIEAKFNIKIETSAKNAGGGTIGLFIEDYAKEIKNATNQEELRKIQSAYNKYWQYLRFDINDPKTTGQITEIKEKAKELGGKWSQNLVFGVAKGLDEGEKLAVGTALIELERDWEKIIAPKKIKAKVEVSPEISVGKASLGDFEKLKADLNDFANAYAELGKKDRAKDANKFNERIAGAYKNWLITLNQDKELQSQLDAITVKSKEEKIASENDFNKQLNDIKEKTAKLRADKDLKDIADEEKRAIEKVRMEAENAKFAAENEMKEKLSAKNLTTEQTRKLESEYQAYIAEVTEDGNAKILDAECKYAKKRIEEKQKTDQELLKNETESQKLRLELSNLKLPELTNSNEILSELQRQSDLKIDILKRENQSKIDEMLRNNKEFDKAQADAFYAEMLLKEKQTEIDKAVAEAEKETNDEIKQSLLNNIEVQKQSLAQLKVSADNARESAESIKNTLLGGEYVTTIRLKEVHEIQTIETTTVTDQREVKINNIKDLAKRESEIHKLEAEKTYKEDLKKSQGNEELKFQAFLKFNKAKYDAEFSYMQKTSTVWEQFAVDFSNSFSVAFANIKFPDNSQLIDSTNASIKSIRGEEDALLQSYYRREQTVQSFHAKQEELEIKRREELRKLADSEKSYWDNWKTAIAETFRSAAESTQKSLQDKISRLNEVNASIAQAEEDQIELKLKIDEAGINGQIELQKKYKEEYDENQKKINTATIESNKLLQETYAKTGLIIGSTFMQMIASGQSFVKASVVAALAGVRAMVPILVVRILGEEFATKGIAGIVTAGILTGLLSAALAAAEAGISKLKFREGVVRLQGPGSQTSDSIPAWLSRDESVVNAKATTAQGNEDLLRWMNKTQLPAIEYFKSDITIEKYFTEKALNSLKTNVLNTFQSNKLFETRDQMLNSRLIEKTIRVQKELEISKEKVIQSNIRVYERTVDILQSQIVQEKIKTDRRLLETLGLHGKKLSSVVERLESIEGILQSTNQTEKEIARKVNREVPVKVSGHLSAATGEINAELESYNYKTLIGR